MPPFSRVLYYSFNPTPYNLKIIIENQGTNTSGTIFLYKNLRYRFGREIKLPSGIISSELDNYPCSVLEMLIALSIRCEETIMTDEEYGDRTVDAIHKRLV